MNPLIMQLFTVFGPIVADLIKKWRAEHNGADPTDAEMAAEFHANIDKYLGEGSAWLAAHPRTP